MTQTEQAKNDKLKELLLSALENVPEEQSVSITDLLQNLFSDFKWENGQYFFDGNAWKHLDILSFAIDFPKIASKHGFYLDNTKYTGGAFGLPENLSFFIRRKPISRKILFKLKEYPALCTPEPTEANQIKVYYDGAVKCEKIETQGFMRTYMTDQKTGDIIDKEKTIKETFGGTYLVNKHIAEKIKEIYRENAEILKTLPKTIDNGSCDGCFQEFSFGAKKITCLNIENRLSDEKTVLRIFTDIQNIIDSLPPKNEWSVSWDDFNFLHASLS